MADGAAGGDGATGAPVGTEQPVAHTPLPGAGTVDAGSLTEKWGEVATGFEEKQTNFFHEQSLADVRTEFPKYFEALEMHPRQMIGMEVPRVDGQEGWETLRDASDAANWQGAAKHLLVQEVQGRVSAKQDEMRETFATIHSSIDLFRNNSDLIPGTQQFDRELADQFASMAKEYELRSNGKLVGYAVPVQPIINQLRTQLTAQRSAAAAPAAPAAPTAQQQRAAEQPRTPVGTFAGPQAAITSKAGQSADPGDDAAQGVLNAFLRQNGVTL